MNIITFILRKDISSIIFKYLNVNKTTVKTNHFKIIRYIDNVVKYFHGMNRKYIPSYVKRDQREFCINYYWSHYKNDWSVIKN
jgi:hypothetical protein